MRPSRTFNEQCQREFQPLVVMRNQQRRRLGIVNIFNDGEEAQSDYVLAMLLPSQFFDPFAVNPLNFSTDSFVLELLAFVDRELFGQVFDKEWPE